MEPSVSDICCRLSHPNLRRKHKQDSGILLLRGKEKKNTDADPCQNGIFPFHTLAFLAARHVSCFFPASVERDSAEMQGGGRERGLDGSVVYFGQMQRSISELLPVIKGADHVEQIRGPCPIRPHFTHHLSSKP